MNDVPVLPSDRQLADAVRDGSDAAWNELVGRHRRAVARLLPNRRERRALDERLGELRRAIEAEGDTPAGEPAVRAFRPRVFAALSGGSYGPTPVGGTGEPGRGRDADLDVLLADAFARLPEPWQTVLWHRRVECLTSAEISPLVGRATQDVADVLTTAERGLADGFLLEYVQTHTLDDADARAVLLLGGHVRGTLSPVEQRVVTDHLAGDPADGRRLIRYISALPERLADAVAPGLTGLSVDEHRRALGTAHRLSEPGVADADRAQGVRRLAVVGAVAAVVVALAGAVFLVGETDREDSAIATDQPDPAVVIDDPDGVVDPDAPADPDAPDRTATPTTAVELRPDASGPVNEIEIVVDDGLRPVGFAVPADDALDVTVTAPAPVYAGGSGTLDVAVSNDSDDDVEAAIELRVPRGIRFDGLVDGPAECTNPADDSAFCNVVVPADETVVLAVRFRLESRVVGRLVVDGDLLDDAFETPIEVTRNLLHSSVGRGHVEMIGNSLMTCDPARAVDTNVDCALVRAGVGAFVNRWDVPMGFVDVAPELGLANSSAAVLDLPDGAEIAAAHLFWSGDLDQRDESIPDDGRNRLATLVPPGGAPVVVEAERLVLGDVDATQYLGSADVTDLVRAGGGGDWIVGDVVSVEVQGSYAAWSLVVVIDDETEPRRQRVVTRPFDWVAPVPRYEFDLDLPVAVVDGGEATLDVLAFEGERSFVPETLTVGGDEVGGQGSFDSSIVGDRTPDHDNNLGVDVDAYDLVIDSADGILPIRVTSEDDGIRIAVLALSLTIAP